MAVDYKTLVQNMNNIYTDGSSAIEYINTQNLTMEEFGQLIDASDRFNAVRNTEGTILNVTEKVSTQVATEGIETALNSNAASVANATTNIPLKVGTNAAGKVTLTQGLSSGLKFVSNTVLPAVAAASAGIMLGKAIDSTLYNLNPDFWDSNGMSALNPETWNILTAGQDGISSNLFNMVFGIDPSTGNTQAYLDQEALAYMTAYMIQQGAFENPEMSDNWSSIAAQIISGANWAQYLPDPLTVNDYISWVWSYEGTTETNVIIPTSDYRLFVLHNSDRSRYKIFIVTDNSSAPAYNGFTINGVPYTPNELQYTYNDLFYRGFVWDIHTGPNITMLTPDIGSLSTAPDSVYTGATGADDIWNAGLILFNGLITGGGVRGITDQSGATVFDPSSITDPTNIAAVLAALQAQYPDLFNNAITQPVGDPLVNPDRILIPVGTPQLNPQDQTQPIANIATQLNPELDPDVYPEPDLQPWVDMILKPELEPEPEPDPDPEPNPPDTGDGITPPVVLPDGTAGALFTVYNPTQGQIDSFGAWLWSSNFVDQLLKVFTNPMEAIISLHKIFCSPSTGSAANIYVGYLNSGVSAAKVTSQYVDVNCGSVSLPEYFGNVFDYTGTNVELYLPFIGIVSLDTADIMRSTINVIYHIDVYTGACLADVSITRDVSGGVLYQYAGNCAVHYPLSSGSYMGIISGLLGVAGTVATGGSAAPMLIGAAGSALTAHTSVQRSGGFSANAGAMGAKKPYLIISRPQSALPANYSHFDGVGSNQRVTIGSCNGYIKIKSLFMDSFETAYENEINEIETLLKSGVLI